MIPKSLFITHRRLFHTRWRLQYARMRHPCFYSHLQKLHLICSRQLCRVNQSTKLNSKGGVEECASPLRRPTHNFAYPPSPVVAKAIKLSNSLNSVNGRSLTSFISLGTLCHHAKTLRYLHHQLRLCIPWFHRESVNYTSHHQRPAVYVYKAVITSYMCRRMVHMYGLKKQRKRFIVKRML